MRRVRRFLASRRPRTLHAKLVIVLLSALAMGLALAAVGTFLSLRSSLIGRVDNQLTKTAQFAEVYIDMSVKDGQGLPTFDSGGQGAGWSAMAQAGLLPSYLEIRDAGNKVVRHTAPGSGMPLLPADLASRAPAGSGAVFFEVPKVS